MQTDPAAAGGAGEASGTGAPPAGAPCWRHGCAVDEMQEGAALFRVSGRRVMVVTIEGRLFAFDDFCPHSGGPMHRGELDGFVMTCPLHGWRFDLSRNGEELHGLRPLPMHPVRIADGVVEVFL